MLSEKIPNGYILYDSIYLTISKWQMVETDTRPAVAKGYEEGQDRTGVAVKGLMKGPCGDGKWT